jgi:hypothetical protein
MNIWYTTESKSTFTEPTVGCLDPPIKKIVIQGKGKQLKARAVPRPPSARERNMGQRNGKAYRTGKENQSRQEIPLRLTL